jgi:hypothetical protein
MPSSDITIHRALVVRVLGDTVYVKIPSILGASESIAVHTPKSPIASWPPSDGNQLLVAVEGEHFNKVYVVANIDVGI